MMQTLMTNHNIYRFLSKEKRFSHFSTHSEMQLKAIVWRIGFEVRKSKIGILYLGSIYYETLTMSFNCFKSYSHHPSNGHNDSVNFAVLL